MSNYLKKLKFLLLWIFLNILLFNEFKNLYGTVLYVKKCGHILEFFRNFKLFTINDILIIRIRLIHLFLTFL